MLIAILVPVVLSVISRLMAARGLKPVYYVLVLLGLAGIGLAILRAVSPSLFHSMFSLFSIFAPTGARLTIMEVTGLLFPQGTFTLSMAWSNFTTSFFISLIALVMLIYPSVREKRVDKILLVLWTVILLIAVLLRALPAWIIGLAMVIYFAIKEQRAERTLLVVWSIIMLAAVVGQRRFGYYYAVNAALLTGYFSWKMLDLAGLTRLLTKPKEVVEVVKKFKKKKKKDREKAKPKTFMQPRGAWVSVIVVGIVLFLMVLFWWNFVPIKEDLNTGAWSFGFPTTTTERQVSGFTRSLAVQRPIMDAGWYNSTSWLKDNTPEPFGDPDFYYELYPPKDEFVYPVTAYGVMSWWDYGYFIMQIGHRIPNANPGQAGAVQAGKFFTAQNESAAREIVEEYNLGTKYVMIDSAMATGKFYAMVDWAGKNLTDFYEYYFVPSQDGGQWTTLFYPAFYQSMAIRLYSFDGKAVTPATNSSIVVSYEEVTSDGQKYKRITSGQAFTTYEAARAYLDSQTSGNYIIVGISASASPVPLQASTDYQRVYPDPADTTASTAVKIFKYLGSDGS